MTNRPYADKQAVAHRRIAGILRDERGNILVVTLLIMFGMVVIGTTLASLSSVDLKLSGNQLAHTQALYAAEAGLSEAIHRIGLQRPTQVTVGTWTGDAAIADAPPLDPNWEVRVYLTPPNEAPAGGGSVVTTGTLQDPSREYINYSRSSGSDGVLTVRHKWEDLDKDGMRDADEIVLYDATKIPPENFATGTPIELVSVTGSDGDATRAIQAEVIRGAIADPGNTLLGALFGNADLRIKKTHAICGYNHDIAISDSVLADACLAYHLDTGHMPGATGTGGATIQVDPAGTITGAPTAIDNSPKPFPTPWEILRITQAEFNNILANADHTSVESTMDGVSYFHGSCVIAQPVVGSGLLYARKKIDIKADFHWKGLVYAGESIQITGDDVRVLGSIVAGGDIDWDASSGDGVLYCAETIRKVVNSPSSSQTVSVLSWQEQ